jgi:catechol 2,3-dioxygenase
MSNPIHPDTRIGMVHLAVADLERSLAFYEQILGFQEHRREGDRAYLGAGAADLLALTEERGARPSRGTTGLYHFAVLVPSRRHLAHSLARLVETETTMQGFADHLVSEAVYLADPDGNGIEIYRDRPRDEWPYERGQLQMASDPLDVAGLLAEVTGQQEAWPGLDPATTIGHIHLHVSDLRQAETFYLDVLGFDLVLRYGPSATFVSAGGYHHHIGLNTWAGAGAPPPPPGSAGLRWYEIVLPARDERERLLERARHAGHEPREQPEGFYLEDPSGNGIMLVAAGSK